MRHKAGVLEAAFDTKAARVVTLAADRAARVWEGRTGALIGQPIQLDSSPDRATPAGNSAVDKATLVRIGTDRVVTVGGVTGLFTPITSASDQPPASDERMNLLTILDQLQREVGEVQSRNLKLDADLALLRQRPFAPEDFAGGLRQSLNELQQRMSTMRNSTSNFAVREFELDASMFVQVMPLGSIEYRFVQPGDNAA